MYHIAEVKNTDNIKNKKNTIERAHLLAPATARLRNCTSAMHDNSRHAPAGSAYHDVKRGGGEGRAAPKGKAITHLSDLRHLLTRFSLSPNPLFLLQLQRG